MAKPAFVGRAAETAAAEHAWAAVRSGARQIIFVGGEPGAGKSRLVAEVGAALHRQGAVVLMGSCSPESAPSYQPFTECLEQLLGGTPEGTLAKCLPDSASELLRLTPLVLRHHPGLQPPLGDDSDYRRELFDALTGLLQSVSRERALVCVLEDLHWARAPTLQLLSHVAQCAAQSRLLLLCTHRTTAPDRSDELTYAIADLYRLDGVRRLDLPGLSTDEIAQYLVAEGGLAARRAREYATVLRDQTGGNPFFLREVWHDVAGRMEAPRRVALARAPPCRFVTRSSGVSHGSHAMSARPWRSPPCSGTVETYRPSLPPGQLNQERRSRRWTPPPVSGLWTARNSRAAG
jgi:predicted ATPase